MKKKNLWLNCLLAVIFFTLATSCKKGSEPENLNSQLSKPENALVSDVNVSGSGIESSNHSTSELLRELKGATSRFNSTTQAIQSGYIPDDHCVSAPGIGGMGYHWVNPPMIDANFDLLKPEVVLYETGIGGNLKLVAVEYIVIDIGQPRPMFGNHPFDIRGTPVQAPHWSLHVWVHKNNPSGVFTRFNPTVSCP